MLVYDVQDLTKIYPGKTQPANKHITLQIQQGEIFGLLGDNGAGKSTLVRQMVGLTRSTSGHIRLFGEDVAEQSALVTQYVGYMPQDGRAFNNLTASEALYFTAHLRGLARSAARQERDRLLDLWQLHDLRHMYITRLSSGQLRLLQIAVTMAASPPILMLDEPTTNLDPQRRKLVWEILRHENQEHGTTIIFITHDAIEAEKIIQRVGIMRAGTLVALGHPGELKQQVDHKLRLEIFFQPETPPQLPAQLTYTQIEEGRWLILLEWYQVNDVLSGLDMTHIDDFRLHSATLEDLYLHYAA